MHSTNTHIEDGAEAATRTDAEAGASDDDGGRPGGPMRMAALVRRTGIPKTTILYYIREGLLPPAEKPFPNQAHYTEAHVERLLLIKQAQSAYHYPLAKIRHQMELVDRGATPAAVARLNERLFVVRAGATSDRQWNLAEYCAETGLPEAVVRDALDAGVVTPIVREPEVAFDSADIEVGHALRVGQKLGLAVSDVAFMVGHARAIAEGEMALRERLVAGRSVGEDVMLTTELTDVARTLHTYIVDRTFVMTALRQPVGGVACEDE